MREASEGFLTKYRAVTHLKDLDLESGRRKWHAVLPAVDQAGTVVIKYSSIKEIIMDLYHKVQSFVQGTG